MCLPKNYVCQTEIERDPGITIKYFISFYISFRRGMWCIAYPRGGRIHKFFAMFYFLWFYEISLKQYIFCLFTNFKGMLKGIL